MTTTQNVSGICIYLYFLYSYGETCLSVRSQYCIINAGAVNIIIVWAQMTQNATLFFCNLFR
jgi:hypothetical protein